MTVMESAGWRRYRRHLIISRTTLLGRRRYGVWGGGRLLDSFRGVIAAERFVDSLVDGSGLTGDEGAGS